MDLIENGIMNAQETAQNVFPPEDYTKKGKLKKVRWRVLKKLLKYDFLALAPMMIISICFLVAITIYWGLYTNTLVSNNKSFLKEIMWNAEGIVMLTYIYLLISAIATPFFSSIKRYRKNFFSQDGYLTFSIPVSIEEHVLSKRISGMLAVLLGGFMACLSSMCLLSFLWRSMDMVFVHLSENIEEFLRILLLGFFASLAVFSVSGAFICWLKKFSTRKKVVVRLVGVYLFFTCVVFPVFFELKENLKVFENPFRYNLAMFHWLFILLVVIVFCTWYEIRALKKINLK